MKKVLKKLDIRDVSLVVGVVSFIGGIAHFSFAIAAIVFGLMCLCVALRPVAADPAAAIVTSRPSTTERQS